VQLTDLIADDIEKDEREDLSLLEGDSELSEETETDCWFGEVCCHGST